MLTVDIVNSRYYLLISSPRLTVSHDCSLLLGSVEVVMSELERPGHESIFSLMYSNGLLKDRGDGYESIFRHGVSL